mgnify:FL=1
MIEEQAIVKSVQQHWVSVLTTQSSSCHQCNEAASCSTSILSKFFGAKEIELKMYSEIPLEKGDHVLIGIGESIFIGLTALIYFVPLCALFLFALLGQYLGPQLELEGELFTIFLAITGFAACYCLIKYLIQHYLKPQTINPVILKKL